MVRRMIERRSFMVVLTGLFAVGIPVTKSEPTSLVAQGSLTPHGREIIEGLMFRTADFPNSDRIAARLARHLAQNK